MKKKLLMIALCVGIVVMKGCVSTEPWSDGDGKHDVVEVLYFHGSQRCITCVEVENLTRNLLKEQFAEPLYEDKLRFRAIDIIEQEDIADEYEVAWSSLLLVDYDSEGGRSVVDMTDNAFFNVQTAPERVRSELAEQLTAMLNN